MTLVERYNSLSTHLRANERFQCQLTGMQFLESQPSFDFRPALRVLLSELAPVFSNGESPPRYAVWLLHGHFHLKEGERMVSRRDGGRDIMEPTTDTSSRIVPERWNNIGEEIEHRVLADGETAPPHPPCELWNGFRQIMEKRGIDTLGICYAPDETVLDRLRSGHIFLERTSTDNCPECRKHVTTLKFQSMVPDDTTETSWIPRDFPPQVESGTCPFIVDGCSHQCTNTDHFEASQDTTD